MMIAKVKKEKNKTPLTYIHYKNKQPNKINHPIYEKKA